MAFGANEAEVRDFLWKLLEGVVNGDTSRSGRDKTVTVLSHIWCQVPEPARPLRDRAVGLLPDAKADERLAIHWALILGTYPFASDVAAGLGKLLALQGEVALSQLTRRLVEAWGDRSTMVRAARRVVRSMVQWGLLKDTGKRGVYELAGGRRLVSDQIAELLLEAVLIDSDNQEIPIAQLVANPALLPFDVRIGAHHLRKAGQFEIHRQGLDIDVVGLSQPARGLGSDSKQLRLC